MTTESFKRVVTIWQAAVNTCIEELSARLGARGYQTCASAVEANGVIGTAVLVREGVSGEPCLGLDFVLHFEMGGKMAPGMQLYSTVVGVRDADNVRIERLPGRNTLPPQRTTSKDLLASLKPALHSGFLYQYCVGKFDLHDLSASNGPPAPKPSPSEDEPHSQT